MRFPDFTIQKDAPRKRSRRAVKGRQFTVTLLAYVCADSLWDLGTDKLRRPVWIAYAGADQACRAFTANFRSGRKAKAGGDRFEIPKSSPHRWLIERRAETAVTVAYLPSLFDLEPTVHPEDVTFAFMPPRWWLERQAEILRPEFGAEAHDVARAALFTAFLDRRSPLPMIQDLRFQLDLYREALDQPWVRPLDVFGPSTGTRAPDRDRLEACGLELPISCRVPHDHFEQFLVRRTNAFFAQEIRDGKNRFRPDCRLLPYPERAPLQLRLDFAVA